MARWREPGSWAGRRESVRPAGRAVGPVLSTEVTWDDDPGSVPALDSQTRAQMCQDYANSVLDHPALVGCHWLQYMDEPLTGRALDGENSNIGLVSPAAYLLLLRHGKRQGFGRVPGSVISEGNIGAGVSHRGADRPANPPASTRDQTNFTF